MAQLLPLNLKRRLGLRSPQPLPHFLGLGTQKGGTTSLHRLLAQHPQVFLPSCKEVHYFSLHDQEPLGWYAAHYAAARAGQLRGDISPYYLFHPRAPQRIRAVVPRARLIVLLRNPVERALSQFFHARRHGFEPLELEAALAAEQERLEGASARLAAPGSSDYSHQKHSYVSRSRYELQLARYEALFPPQQLLVLRSEDLFGATEACWHQIQSFLGLAAVALPAPLEQANAGRGEAAAVPEAVRAQLRRQLTPTIAAMAERYGVHWD
ncbi:sulfotransferase [Cyanobium sp. ATX 6E8]|uniref:sulfotransferase n=1 Tax=Cyanobium sp. ATX 6E8 TaxID=2823701 RepID=UPI0020CE3C43|nr:sulfotransferase [Cyanobium sp. ATX 6E8]MCP9941965.1 sulfotransferase [Cyanobium sp. ATX 6E8]